MALEKMQALATYLKSQNLFAAEQFDYWMENGTSVPASKKVGKGMVLSRFEYDAVFDVERYAGSADLFLALLSVWLMDNDDNRNKLELVDPAIEVHPLDDQTVDLEVTVRFSEDITVMPDDEGLILFNGNRYSIAPALITDANKVGVGDSQQRPTDKTYDRDEA